MEDQDQKNKLVEFSSPKPIKEIESIKKDEVEKNSNLEALNDSDNILDNINNHNGNDINPINIISMEQKEPLDKQKENQKIEKIEKEKEEAKVQSDINEEKNQNLDLTANNNLSDIIDINNKDIVNLVKSESYLTSLPLSNNRDKTSIKLNNENRKTYNFLKKKENSLYLEINAIKRKREQLTRFSFDLGEKSVIENNIRESELKKLKKNENNLIEKLEAIKMQISDLLNNEKIINRRNNIKEFLEKIKNNEENNDIISKTKKNRSRK